MNEFVRQTIGKWSEVPPIPPEAFPPGNRMIPGAHASLMLAWEAMGKQMFFNGAQCMGIVLITIFLAVAFRGQILKTIDAIRGAIHHAA